MQHNMLMCYSERLEAIYPAGHAPEARSPEARWLPPGPQYL